MQTWVGSIVEMKANLAVGFILNYGVNIAVLPFLWNGDKPFSSAFWIGCVFTVVSVCRQLFLRRFFNGIKFGNAPAEAKP